MEELLAGTEWRAVEIQLLNLYLRHACEAHCTGHVNASISFEFLLYWPDNVTPIGVMGVVFTARDFSLNKIIFFLPNDLYQNFNEFALFGSFLCFSLALFKLVQFGSIFEFFCRRIKELIFVFHIWFFFSVLISLALSNIKAWLHRIRSDACILHLILLPFAENYNKIWSGMSDQ